MKVSKKMNDYLLGACMLGIQIEQGITTPEAFVKWKNGILKALKEEE